MSQLSQLQQAAGVTKVIWIDDLFSGKAPEEQLRAHINSSISRLFLEKLRPRHDALKNIDLNTPENIRAKQIDKVLNDYADKLPRILDSLIKQESECLGGAAQPESADFNFGQIVSLRDSLSGVITFSLSNWNANSVQQIKEADEKCLFLIDREFDKEGVIDDAGDDLIASITQSAPNSLCIMLTHTVGHTEVEDLRLAVAKKIGVPAHRFAVMSKRYLGQLSNDVDPYFALALKTTMLHRFCSDVAALIVKIMGDASQHTIDDLASLSVEEIDTAIFENSIEEGASEIDVIVRLLTLQERITVQSKMVSDADGFYKQLARIRAVRDIEICERHLPKSIGRKGLLRNWRIKEVFDDGEYLNPINSPLSCGDVFLSEMDKSKYVLLAQPCDITVRGKGSDCGKRKREDGILIKLNPNEPKEPTRESFFRIEGMEKDDSSWFLYFRNAVIVDLRLFDLTVMNSDGRVEWKKDQQVPITMLPGWQARFKERSTEMAIVVATKSPPSLCFSDKTILGECIFKEGGFSYPFKRIGRIRSPYAEAILGSYAAFISRAAFDHDFAKGLCFPTDKGVENGE